MKPEDMSADEYSDYCDRRYHEAKERGELPSHAAPMPLPPKDIDEERAAIGKQLLQTEVATEVPETLRREETQ